MRLLYCPSCMRVYALPNDGYYLCARNHATKVWPDGVKRRFVISERSETDRPPWFIPPLVEESEIVQVDFLEDWLDACKYPKDAEFSDRRRHFGYATIGGRHLTMNEAMGKYVDYVLKPLE